MNQDIKRMCLMNQTDKEATLPGTGHKSQQTRFVCLLSYAQINVTRLLTF